MNTSMRTQDSGSERGVALLIAIFALMLISVVALSLLLLSGTESAIAGNYRTSTQSFYAAYAGLEEARGRLWAKHPNTVDALIPNTLNVGQVLYITNPAPGEIVAPTNAANAYYDSEYFTEWGVQASALGANAQTTVSVSNVGGVPGPLFKWVRITPKTEASANQDVDGSGGALNNATPLFYDGVSQFLQNAPPPAEVDLPEDQVYRVTSFSVLPNGAQRRLQVDVARITVTFTFPSALTLNGGKPTFAPSNSQPYQVDGNDSSPGGANCPPVQAGKPAIGVIQNNDVNPIDKSIPKQRQSNYTGGGLPTPSVSNVGANIPLNEASPSQLETIVSQIESIADYVVQGPTATLPSYGTASSPVVVVVDSPNSGSTANLTISGAITGYGILVVRGTYSPSGTVGWNGMVLVIGQGDVVGLGGGSNSYNGAIFVAKTRDATGNLLNNLGSPIFDWSGGGGNGIFYNSCSINNATQGQTYRILSFHEIQ